MTSRPPSESRASKPERSGRPLDFVSRTGGRSMKAHDLLSSLGLPARDLPELPDSEKRFPDGARYRVEIPSVEGPKVLEAVLDEAEKRGVQLHRVSQGSGIMLLTDAEIRAMCDLAREANLELSLFVGPRAAWETGAAAISGAGKVLGAQHRGQDQLAYALEDVLRGCPWACAGCWSPTRGSSG